MVYWGSASGESWDAVRAGLWSTNYVQSWPGSKARGLAFCPGGQKPSFIGSPVKQASESSQQSTPTAARGWPHELDGAILASTSCSSRFSRSPEYPVTVEGVIKIEKRDGFHFWVDEIINHWTNSSKQESGPQVTMRLCVVSPAPTMCKLLGENWNPTRLRVGLHWHQHS